MSEVIKMNNPRVEMIHHLREARKNQAPSWLALTGGLREGRAPIDNPGRDVDPAKALWEILPDGAWAGHRAFIIGGGPSLTGFDFSKLRGEIVVGVNRAFEHVDCQILFSMDSRFHDWLRSGRLGDDAKKAFAEYGGLKVWLDTHGHPFVPGIRTVRSLGASGLTTSLKDGVYHGENSGYAALNLAVCLGADPIYLLGFDGKLAGDGRAHHHEEYPLPTTQGVLDKFVKYFHDIAPELQDRGVRVVNLNPDSAIRCFEFDRLEALPAIRRPVVVSYWTAGSGYAKEAEYLVRSCRGQNLEADVREVPDLGNWQANTRRKAAFILEALDRHPGRGVVFVDADAVFRTYPFEFEDIREHVGLCWRDYALFPAGGRTQGRELLSGTIYFSPTDEARDLLRLWIRENERNPLVWEQQNLERIVTHAGWDGMIKEFPASYCQIFDSMKSAGAPVIEHFQASRRLKEKA